MKQTMIVLVVALLCIPIVVFAVNETNSSINETISLNQTINVSVNETNDVVENSTPQQPLRRTELYPTKNSIAASRVSAIEDCTETSWQTTEPVMGTCQRNVVCAPENVSCTGVEEYTCKVNDEIVTHIKETCRQRGLVLDNKYSLDTAAFKCSATEQGSETTVVCDSRYDGNGDGICSSGETCMKYVLKNGNLQTLQKNSRDVFVESDVSFFLETPILEVVQ